VTSGREPFGGGIFIADTSAWARSGHEALAKSWAAAMRGGQIVATPLVTLEVLRSARHGAEFDEVAADFAQLRTVPLTRSVTRAAQQAMRRLAHLQPMYQRSVKLPDLLIAAAAEDAGVGVLHYDEDYDVLANVMAFESRWIAPRGSL
jgi:predicted nucleic acid-binding protein